MSTKTKFYTLLAAAMLVSTLAFSQARLLEFTRLTQNTAPLSGNGFGPRTTSHVVTFNKDRLDNGNFNAQGSSPDPITPPFISATIAFQNQQFTGLTYGAGTTNGTGTSNAVTNGLMFGAGPSEATGSAPGTPATQQATPLNSYNLLGSFNGGGGPRNPMFMSDGSNAPSPVPYPTAGNTGTGIDAEGLLPGAATDANGGVCAFTCAQVMYDLGRTHNTATRHYYGDLTITFSRFVSNPVIHIAGLGGSYRYLPVGQPDLPANYLSCFFSTELELVGGGAFSLTKMASNQFLSVSGLNILNNSTTPNGESFDIGVPPPGQFNNFGAATGSIRVNGPAVRLLRFRVYLRGADASQFAWSARGIAGPGGAQQVSGGTRDPLTGDIWFISASLKQEQLIPLPATGMRLDAALNSSNDVLLSWKTLSELDTREFEIQRSTDGVNFSTLATKAAAGNSAVELSYTHTDANMQVPVYYYRLKLVDIDNDYSYSNIAVVRKAGSVRGVRAFPNPAAGQLNLEFSNAKGNYIISLYNQAGQEVAAQKTIINYDVQYITVNRNSLPAGSYIVKVRNTENGESFNQHVILQ